MDAVARGRQALHTGDGHGSRAAFEEALATLGPTPEVLEGLGSASWVLMDHRRAIDELERAYAGYRAAGDGSGSVRMARMVAGLHGSTTGSWAVASGWIARARTLLSEAPDDRERGWVALVDGMFEQERTTKERHLREALRCGEDAGDDDLRFGALAYLGASLVHGDRVAEGMALLDEALAAVAGGDVGSVVVVEEIFCQLFAACEHARDVSRAEQWIAVGDEVARRRGLPAVAAYCHTHYGAVLTAAGRWQEADVALTEAVRLWQVGRRTLKNDAIVRLAGLRLRQGRGDEAAALLEGATGDDAVLVSAALHLERGEAPLALEVLEQAVRAVDLEASSCIPLLALLVEAQLACGEDPAALVGSVECARAHPSEYAAATASRAEGLVRGDRALLRRAADGYAAAHLPHEAGRCRLELARLLESTDTRAACVEARAALEAFTALAADRDADAAAALLRRRGVPVPPPRTSHALLTVREQEVLALVGTGHSNPEIAGRLFISRKTVEHHVGNILAKLGLRNRAEAAAYTARQGNEPATK